jgi:hypothetical protein
VTVNSMPINLDDYKTNVYSQGGEDGVIQKILQEAGIVDGFFVEFGAWDGVHLSNTCHLARSGWGGVFIEADEQRFRQLKGNHSSPNVDLINAFITAAGPRSLSNILKTQTQYGGRDPSVLSIDIDSDDLAIWQSLTELRPFLVVIEYNPTIPADVSFQNPLGGQLGNSALAIFEHATRTKYEFVAQTATNMIFVDSLRLPTTIEPLDFFVEQRRHGTRLFFGYDGTLLRSAISPSGEKLIRADELLVTPWVHAIFPQPLPRFARRIIRRSKAVSAIALSTNVIMAVLMRPIGTSRFALRDVTKATAYARRILRFPGRVRTPVSSALSDFSRPQKKQG